MKCIFWLAVLAILTASCGDAKRLQYLQGPMDAGKYSAINYTEPVIQPGDILSISVYSDNPAASAIYNQTTSSAAASGSGSSGTSSPAASGYLVDQSGKIRFQGMGAVEAKNLTRQQLADKIERNLDTLLNNPNVQVRFLNFKITVIGEVNSPAVFSVPSEKVTFFEAIGLAGDLTSFGRRDSVLIIRESPTERKMGWIDLRKTDIFSSEYYYLHQNDVIVVHPTRAKAASSNEILYRNVSLAATIVSTLAVVYSIIINN